jgi:hypothetical protein
MNDSWIIIAPLVDNVFNRCKSGLKFWESGVFGIPVISSPIKDIERFKNKGICISDNIYTWGKFITSMEVQGHYEAASVEAIEKSQLAIFTQKSSNYRYTYLKLTGEFGPRWPSIIINPTDIAYVPLNSKYNELTDIESQEVKLVSQQLQDKVSHRIGNDIPPKVSKVLRKIKKLKDSPLKFFSDIKVFKN